MANTKHTKSINKIQLMKGAIALSYTMQHHRNVGNYLPFSRA